MEPELTKLATLLEYTIEHNKEHAEELQDMAQKARKLGKAAAYDDILKGAEQMKQASETLAKALKRL